MTDVTVLVPVLNEEERLRETAAAMLAQAVDTEVEYLFIDGRSTDRTRDVVHELARADPRVRLLDNPKRRVAAALNVGLRAARGEYVARMDAHTFYPRSYLADGIARLERGDVAWVSGPQLAFGDGRWSRRIALAMDSPLGIGGARFRRIPSGEIETDAGYTGIWRRETLERLGGWDEAAVVNEDGELAARVRERGGRIVCLPEMAARCMTRDSLPALAAQYRRYGTYRARTLRLHPATMRCSHALSPALAATVLAAASPGRVGRAARLALVAYAVVIAAEGARCARTRSDGVAVALALASMHLSWGTGFLGGCVRFGPPLAAVGGLVTRRRR
jgi:succinoglycan biosynthesis protein ExoA